MTADLPASQEEPVESPPVKLWRNRVVRVPSVLQMEAVECGAASLAMILASFGRWIPPE
jgi:hypothetical protein